MSDIEASNRSQSEDEVDDLFGDDEENPVKASTQSGDENDNRESNGIVNDDEEDDDEDDNTPQRDLKTLGINLPRHAASHQQDGETYSIKMPVFLNVEAHPFDPSEFKEKVAQNAAERSKSSLDAKAVHNDVTAEKLLNENTIRWRYSNSGNDEIIKQSNAHFIQWEDGSLSLKIGKELFDFRGLPVTDSFLARSHVEHEILQNDSIITKTANLLPSSTATDTHRKLTQAVKNIQKKDKILNTLTEGDPMMKQRLADENERKTLKMKRQLEQKRRLQEERMGKSDSPAPSRGGYVSAYERFENTYGQDEYDDEDDFVANDDEEPEMDDEGDDLEIDAEQEEEEFDKGAERLKNLKESGEAQYRTASPEEGEDRRKRRRIIDSDDDE